MAAVETLAAWSPWVPFEEALKTAPLLPGVYMAREALTARSSIWAWPGSGPVVGGPTACTAGLAQRLPDRKGGGQRPR